ncbi:MAG: PTS sugar transporter subunit IIA [bacterium]
MIISRYIQESAVKLELETIIEPLEDGASREKWCQRGKELILSELVSLLETDNRVGNRTKLVLDFVNREKKATTGIGDGIAIPHIRSLQAKEFMIGFGRSTKGYEFDALDGLPVHMFFVMAAPPYDDNLYLKVFKSLMEMLQYDSFRQELMNAKQPGELIRSIRQAEG